MDATSYHDRSKHHFGRFARSLGYLDWATQPDPFRRYIGAAEMPLPRPATVPGRGAALSAAAVCDTAAVGSFLRHALGLSAWKAHGGTRWALRVNPSSGNLHPTEAYVIRDGVVEHYAPEAHLLERRALLGHAAWRLHAGERSGFLVALTSVHWREAWKYGERAFRYCQHDVGHAIGALCYSAALFGWTVRLLPQWSDLGLARVLGTDRGDDWIDAESETVACVVAVGPVTDDDWGLADPAPLVAAAARAVWTGRPTRLSAAHVDWPVIDDVARATAFSGGAADSGGGGRQSRPAVLPPAPGHDTLPAPLLLRRRSAVAFDPRPALPRAAFDQLLDRLAPSGLPFDAWPWPAQVNLVLFVHRVEGLTPGVYSYLRVPAMRAAWQGAMRPEFLWERADDRRPLDLLVPTDVTFVANRLSCDQSIASDGYLSLGMVARFAEPLRIHGDAFYRRLFWECGLIGQALYLEAEAVGARGTGIGCFFDDAVHDMLGLSGHDWQSLYHFALGLPVDDARLTTSPGYDWEEPPTPA